MPFTHFLRAHAAAAQQTPRESAFVTRVARARAHVQESTYYQYYIDLFSALWKACQENEPTPNLDLSSMTLNQILVRSNAEGGTKKSSRAHGLTIKQGRSRFKNHQNERKKWVLLRVIDRETCHLGTRFTIQIRRFDSPGKNIRRSLLYLYRCGIRSIGITDSSASLSP